MDINISYVTFGDSILERCWLIIGVHSSPNQHAKHLSSNTAVYPYSASGMLVWAPFNTPEHVVSYSKDDPSFNLHAFNNNSAPPLRTSMPTPNQHASIKSGVNVGYYLHRANDNPTVLAGSTVIHLDGLCPAFDPTDN